MDLDFRRLETERIRLQAATLAPRTIRAYAYGWLHFTRWCQEAAVTPLPCTSQHLALYVVSSIDRGLKITTVTIHLAAVKHEHRKAGLASPADDSIRTLITGARRHLKEQPRRKTALTTEHLSKIVTTADGSVISERNRAMLVLGFATGLRRAELAALDVADLQFVPEGLKVHIRASKTDQNGVGREVGIWPGSTAATCPVRNVQCWLTVRGQKTGPLFPQITNGGVVTACRLSGEGISRAVKRSVKSIELDPASYAGHSLRAGCVTAAWKAGASVLSIMQRTGHKSVQTIYRYVRPASAFDVNPLANVL